MMTSRWTLTFLLSSAETMAGKRKQMSTPQKEVAISLFEDGENQCWIAEILGVSQSGVSTFLKRFNQRESCENEWRSGRPRKTDDRSDRKILRCVKTDRWQSLTEITNKVFKWIQASTLTYFSTCPFGQLTKKSTCPTQSFSCPKKLIKITKTRE